MAGQRGQISSFTASGKKVAALSSNRGKGLQLGVRDPDTGRIIRGPKPEADGGLKAGPGVRILNRAALGSRQARLYPSLGVGLVGDPRS